MRKSPRVKSARSRFTCSSSPDSPRGIRHLLVRERPVVGFKDYLAVMVLARYWLVLLSVTDINQPIAVDVRVFL